VLLSKIKPKICNRITSVQQPFSDYPWLHFLGPRHICSSETICIYFKGTVLFWNHASLVRDGPSFFLMCPIVAKWSERVKRFYLGLKREKLQKTIYPLEDSLDIGCSRENDIPLVDYHVYRQKRARTNMAERRQQPRLRERLLVHSGVWPTDRLRP
jgi:hypothetical protein